MGFGRTGMQQSVTHGEDLRARCGDRDGVLAVGAAGAVLAEQGPAVLRVLEDLVGRLEIPRFDGDHEARKQLVALVRSAVVRHMRVAVHDAAHAVAAEFVVDRVAVGARHVADGMRDVSKAVARLCGCDAGGQSLFGSAGPLR